MLNNAIYIQMGEAAILIDEIIVEHVQRSRTQPMQKKEKHGNA